MKQTPLSEGPDLSSAQATAAAQMPFPELFKRAGTDVTTLIGRELMLARLDFAEKVPQIGRSAGFFGAAAAFGLGAFLALTTTLIAALAAVVPFWAAALTVTVLYTVLAAVAVSRATSSLKGVGDPLPRLISGLRIDLETIRAGFGRGR